MTRIMCILGTLALLACAVATLAPATGVKATAGSATSGQPPVHRHTPGGPLGVPRTASHAEGKPAIHPSSLSGSSTAPSFTAADVTAYLLTNSQSEITPVQGAHLSVEKVQFVSDSEATQLMQGEDPGLPADAVVCFVLIKGPFHVQADLPLGAPAGAYPTATEVGEVFDSHSGNLLEWGILDSFPMKSPAQAATHLAAPSVTSSSQPFAASSPARPVVPSINYICQSPRCYGTNWWPNAVNGAYTYLNWSPWGALLGAGSTPDGLIRNAMWIVDKTAQHANECYVYQSDAPGLCFVEAGIKSSIVNGSNETDLFWADVRPGYFWYEHEGPIIDTTSSTSGVDIEIWRAGTISGDTSWCPIAGSEWCVDVYSRGDGTNITGISGAGNKNTMIVSGYQEGLELYGTSGATADYMYFDDNQWEANGGTNWNYQTNIGDNTQYAIDPPVDAWWTDGYQPAPGNYGGSWFTCLSGAGC